MKESGFRPLLCTYRPNWARRTSWGWWVEWDDTVLQTQDSKFEPWRSEAEHATSRSRRLPTILSFTSGWGRNIMVSFKPPRPGNEPRTLAWKAVMLTTTLGPPDAAAHRTSTMPTTVISVYLINLYASFHCNQKIRWRFSDCKYPNGDFLNYSGSLTERFVRTIYWRVRDVIRMIRNRFVSKISPFDWYGSGSDCTFTLIVAYRHE